MDIVLVREFFDFIQNFMDLCWLEEWPTNNTTDTELKNAFMIAQHVEKCLDKLQKNNLICDFLSSINKDQKTSSYFLKKCLSDPPKCILKKIINTNTNITLMDTGFKIFLELYSKEKLEKYLADLMVETASTETLLKNLSKELPKEKILIFKSQLFLSELVSSESPKTYVERLLSDCNEDTLKILVISLSNNDVQYASIVNNVIDVFLTTMSLKNNSCKKFWRLLFDLEEKYLIPMCLEHNGLFIFMAEALLDCGKLLHENISAELFYIDLSYSELATIVQKLTKHDKLRDEFLLLISNGDSDLNFWRNIM